MGFPRLFAEGLASQIKAGIPGLVAVYAEWPEKNQASVYPSMTIESSAPQYTRCSPYLTTQGSTANNAAINIYCVGEYEITAQIDIWTRRKVERDQYYQLLWNLLEPTQGAGFTFPLADYFGEYVTVWQTGYRFMDNEDSVTRKEWRANVQIGATCRAMNTTTDYIITQPPVLTFTTPDSIT